MQLPSWICVAYLYFVNDITRTKYLLSMHEWSQSKSRAECIQKRSVFNIINLLPSRVQVQDLNGDAPEKKLNKKLYEVKKNKISLWFLS